MSENNLMPNTPRVSSPKRSAKAAAHPVPASATEPQPRLERQPYLLRDLTETQQDAVNLFADMLLRGPFMAEDLDSVLAGLVQHRWQLHGHQRASQTELDREVGEYRTDLLRAFSEREPLRSVAVPGPDGTITDFLRANYRGALVNELDAFVGDASAEETWILLEVLRTRECQFAHTPLQDEYQIPLLAAFQLECENHRLFRVPDRFEDQVIAYVKMLIAAEARAQGKDA